MAALQPLPLMGSTALGSLPAGVSQKLKEDINADMVVAYHPAGLITFIARMLSPHFSYVRNCTSFVPGGYLIRMAIALSTRCTKQ